MQSFLKNGRPQMVDTEHIKDICNDNRKNQSQKQEVYYSTYVSLKQSLCITYNIPYTF
jgi:hypothetical protein